jgi:hypothetical protein
MNDINIFKFISLLYKYLYKEKNIPLDDIIIAELTELFDEIDVSCAKTLFWMDVTSYMVNNGGKVLEGMGEKEKSIRFGTSRKHINWDVRSPPVGIIALNGFELIIINI